MRIPASGVYKVKTFPVYTDFHYNNLRYDQFKFDIHNAAMNFTHMAEDGAAVVYFELPVVKRWDIAFDFFFDLLWYHQGQMTVRMKRAQMHVTTELKATHDGHLFPHLHDFRCDIS